MRIARIQVLSSANMAVFRVKRKYWKKNNVHNENIFTVKDNKSDAGKGESNMV
jgi:hypothetical protein